MPNKRALEAMIFNPGTTYKADFRWLDFKPKVENEYVPKPPRIREKPQRLKDINTLAPLKDNIPFHLLHKRNEILISDPRRVPRQFDKPMDYKRELIIKTRPRVVMTPAVSLDDIENTSARELLCSDMYLTDTAKGLKEARDALPPCPKVIAPFPGLPAPAQPILLPKLQFPLVSPEWRKETVTWETMQLRGYCDPNKSFWLGRPLSKSCKACQETAIVESHRKSRVREMRRMKIGR